MKHKTALMETTLQLNSEHELRAELIRHSKQYGGAWVASVLPFGGPATLCKFENPSSVPDSFCEGHGEERGIAWKGKRVAYSNAVIIREQNRGLTCE